MPVLANFSENLGNAIFLLEVKTTSAFGSER